MIWQEHHPRRLLATEVIQTSAMDCGPAALKCLLESFGIPVSYGRLREACQTDVDGTSIDTLEEIAGQLGLDAEQVMLPSDHLLLPEAKALPAMLIVQLSSGMTHVVVVWRRHGPFVQVMDPGTGRRWVRASQLLREVYTHEMRVPANGWHEWAASPDFLIPLARRLKDIGLVSLSAQLIAEATENGKWIGLATLDAATRLTSSLVRNKALKPGREAGGFIKSILRRATHAAGCENAAIPQRYWSVRPAPQGEAEASDEEEVLLRGIVLVRVRGCRSMNAKPDSPPDLSADPEQTQDSIASAVLTAALDEPPPQPLRELFKLMRGHGVISWAVLALALTFTAGTLIFEIFLLRGALDIGYSINLIPQRLLAVAAFLVYILFAVALELQVTNALLHLGRRLELNLRSAVFATVPRLADQYFRSRPVSDMAERAHVAHQLRVLPRLGGQFARDCMALLASGCALIWLYPQGWPITLLAIGMGLVVPFVFMPQLQEVDLRVRTHTGALIRFYLDSMLGLTVVRAHGAESTLLREQESLLVEWYRSSQQRIRAMVSLEGWQATTGFGLTVCLLFSYATTVGDPAGAILVAYLALYIPVLGEELALLVRQFPLHRNLILRLLELLNAPIDEISGHLDTNTVELATEVGRNKPAQAGVSGKLPDQMPDTVASRPYSGLRQILNSPASAPPRGVGIVLDAVTVRAGGHVILDNLDLHIEPGEHVAIIGASGSGKSSLVGLFLGWHRPSSGDLRVDGQPLDGAKLDRLRQGTVWIDPAVHLWNRPLLANLTYGAEGTAAVSLMNTLDDVDLLDLLQRLPEGLQTVLGEGGGLVSGGEGQRVRVARGLSRPQPRLVVLDEAFRGLERKRRATLLKLSKERWRDASLLCITHDVDHTGDFDRVLVLREGGIVEQGTPAALLENPLSHYRTLLDTAAAVRNEIWADPQWQRLNLQQGRLHPEDADARN